MQNKLVLFFISLCFLVAAATGCKKKEAHNHAHDKKHAHAKKGEHSHSKKGEHSHSKKGEHAHAKKGEHAHAKKHEHAHAKKGEHSHAKKGEHAHAKKHEHAHEHGKKHEHGHDRGLSLNKGKKWEMDKHTRASLLQTSKTFSSADHSKQASLHKTGLTMKKELSQLINGCKMKGPSHDQLHVFLTKYMPALNALVAGKDLASTQKAAKEIKHLLTLYKKFFK